MQLEQELVALKSTSLLPAIGYALVAALLIGLGVGGFVAWKWQEGSQAIEQRTELRKQVDQLETIATDLGKLNVQQAGQMRAAINRMNAISQARENDEKNLKTFAGKLAGDLDKVRQSDSALRDLDLGPDFLRHWNQANSGPAGAATAAPATAGRSGASVPAAATSAKRKSAGHAGAARPGNGDVPRLPKPHAAADRRGGGMAGHGLALVLRGGNEGRYDAGRMRA